MATLQDAMNLIAQDREKKVSQHPIVAMLSRLLNAGSPSGPVTGGSPLSGVVGLPEPGEGGGTAMAAVGSRDPRVHVFMKMLAGRGGPQGLLRMNATEMKGLAKDMPAMAEPEVAGIVNMGQTFPAKSAAEAYSDLRGLPGYNMLPGKLGAPQPGQQVSLGDLISEITAGVNRKLSDGQSVMSPSSKQKELDAIFELMTTYAKRVK